MKNKILITITTIEGGIKEYTITQFIKKFLIFIISIFVIIFVILIFLVKFLNNDIKKYKEQLNALKSQKEKLLKEKEKLLISIKKQKLELEKINDKISDIENILNLNPKTKNLSKRLDLAKLNLIDKKIMLEFIPNGYPVVFKGITSPFGWRKHPILKRKEFHPGVDLRAKLNTPVYATADGIVEFAAYHKSSGYGNLIIIDHNYGFKTLFGHLNKILVKRGEFVKKGELIGYTGNTGLSNGPHLHYEVRFLNMPLNATYFCKWSLKNYKIMNKERKVQWQSLLQMINLQKQILQAQSFQKAQK